MILPSALGVLTIDLHDGQTHQWATGVRLFHHGDQLRLEWFEDQHPHGCAVIGMPRIVGDQLRLDTDPHGPVVVRAIGPSDTWLVFPANCTAWEAHQQGLT
jgi:hypothetical protein